MMKEKAPTSFPMSSTIIDVTNEVAHIIISTK